MELDHDTMYYSDYLEAVGLQQKQYLSKQNTLISWQKLLPNFKKPLHCFGSLKTLLNCQLIVPSCLKTLTSRHNTLSTCYNTL